MFVMRIATGKVFQTKFGALKHDDVLNQTYGSKINCSKGYVYVLKLTPELWTVCLPHRTQIMYYPDISMIIFNLDIRFGSVVIEAGTGSGSMTHSLARTVGPSGQIYTFDFHENRVIEARNEFRDHGLSHIISTGHRDVCSNGFPGDLTSKIDAIFLDLPHPWECVPHAKIALKKFGRICCFSPCIEQVQKTSQALNRLRFIDISTFEVLLKPYEVKTIQLKELTFDDLKHTTRNNDENPDQKVPLLFERPEPMVPDVLDDGDMDDDHDDMRNGSMKTKNPAGVKSYTCACPTINIAGHTGFLTFATCYQP